MLTTSCVGFFSDRSRRELLAHLFATNNGISRHGFPLAMQTLFQNPSDAGADDARREAFAARLA